MMFTRVGRISGFDAEPFLQRLQTNDVSAIQPGRIRYGMMLDDDGGVLDDVLVYREPAGDGFFMVINAGNTERNLEVMAKAVTGSHCNGRAFFGLTKRKAAK